MPRERKPNIEKKIAGLIADLKSALVAREKQRIESAVATHVDSLVRELSKGVGGDEASPAPAITERGTRKPRSAASRAAQSKKMKAYWAAKRKGKKTAKASAAPGSSSAK